MNVRVVPHQMALRKGILRRTECQCEEICMLMRAGI